MNYPPGCTQSDFDRETDRLRLKEAEKVADPQAMQKLRESLCKLCSDCPPNGYPTDKTRCLGCPRAKFDDGEPMEALLDDREVCAAARERMEAARPLDERLQETNIALEMWRQRWLPDDPLSLEPIRTHVQIPRKP